MTLPSPFPVARYRFECVVETPLHLPEYAGSALRGAFGNALRRTACMTRQKECKPCPLYRTCPYPAIFQPPPPAEHSLQKFSEIPSPFIVEPPEWGERSYEAGETLKFGFVLCGRPMDQLPLVIYAWQRALAHGIGRGEGTARLEQVWLETGSGDQCVFEAACGQLLPHDQSIATFTVESSEPSEINLIFSTPLRIQHEGVPLRPEAISCRDLLVALARRISLISEFHLGQKLDIDFQAVAGLATNVQSSKRLEWRDWTRYSSRQKQEMVLGGCIGTWKLAGHISTLLPLLHLGQWLHAGKNASFGLGRYDMALTAG